MFSIFELVISLRRTLPSNGGITSGNDDTSVEITGHSTDISVPNISNIVSASVEHLDSAILAHSPLPIASANTHPM